MERLVVGLVRGAHGLHGAVRVEILTDRPGQRFVAGARLAREGEEPSLTVAEARPADVGWIVRFEEVADRDAAAALVGTYLEAEPDRVSRPAGTWYWHEVVGAPVRGPDGSPLGTVRDVYRAGGAEVFVVDGGPRGPFDVPAVSGLVLSLDPAGTGIVVDPAALALDEPNPDGAPARRPSRRPRRVDR